MRDPDFFAASPMRSTLGHHVAAPLFRLTVDIEDPALCGDLEICGLGFYDLWLNGEKITKGYLAPYIANPDHIVTVDRYLMAERVKPGPNVLCVVLGNGFQNNLDTVWVFDRARHNGVPRFALEWPVGDRVIGAGDFKVTASEITFDAYRMGVHVDGRLRIADVWDPELDMSAWAVPVPAESPRGELRPAAAEPVRVAREVRAVSVTPGRLAPYRARADVAEAFEGRDVIPVPTGEGFVYDFGVNTAGIFRLTIDGTPGQRIVIDVAERIVDGAVDPTNISFFYPEGYGQRDVYICRGEGPETFEPPFTYHGGRYLFVSGITEAQATEELVTFLELHSDLAVRAEFRCSDPTLTELWTHARRSDLSNFHYFPTDCPHREKNGWTGDIAVSAEHLLLTLAAERSLEEWLVGLCRAQAPSGALPGIVPTGGWGFDWGNGPAWDHALFEVPYRIFVTTGRTQVLSDALPSMLRYLHYIAGRRDARGIVEIGLGDWCPVGREADDYLIPLGLSDTIIVTEMCRIADSLFTHEGQSPAAAFARSLGAELRTAIRTIYLDPATLCLAGHCQSAQAMGLHYGIFDPGERPEAYRRLIEMIHRAGDHMDVGILGGRVLFHVLSEGGDTDLALRMITTPEYPSYGYNLTRGATSLWEMILPEPQLSGSENHHFWGDISHWMLRHVLGLRVNPDGTDPNRIVLTPRFPSGMTWAEGHYQAPNGLLQVAWEKADDGIRLTVEKDPGLSVDLRLPYPLKLEANGHQDLRNVASGTYRIRV